MLLKVARTSSSQMKLTFSVCLTCTCAYFSSTYHVSVHLSHCTDGWDLLCWDLGSLEFAAAPQERSQSACNSTCSWPWLFCVPGGCWQAAAGCVCQQMELKDPNYYRGSKISVEDAVNFFFLFHALLIFALCHSISLLCEGICVQKVINVGHLTRSKRSGCMKF